MTTLLIALVAVLSFAPTKTAPVTTKTSPSVKVQSVRTPPPPPSCYWVGNELKCC